MSKKHIKVCRVLNYIEHLLVLVSAVTGCVSISTFASLVGILVGICEFCSRIKKCVITAGIKNHKPLIKKKKKKHYETVLLAKSKLNSIDDFISKTLIDSIITHNEFVSINNMLKGYKRI